MLIWLIKSTNNSTNPKPMPDLITPRISHMQINTYICWRLLPEQFHTTWFTGRTGPNVILQPIWCFSIWSGWLFHQQNVVICVPQRRGKEGRQKFCISRGVEYQMVWACWELQAYSWRSVKFNWLLFLTTVLAKAITGLFYGYFYFWLEGISANKDVPYSLFVDTDRIIAIAYAIC